MSFVSFHLQSAPKIRLTRFPGILSALMTATAFHRAI
jgi:hypothetical protein